MPVAARSPLVSAVRSRSAREHEKRKEERGVMGHVLRVVRRDREFLTRRFRSVSKALGDIFWLRNLEDPRALHASRPPAHWPKISHPPGLWGVDLMMADLEALKVYAGYIQLASRIWSVPLPDLYDPQKVSDYFNCRPHVLAFRIIEVVSSFALVALKMQMSRSFSLSRHGVSRDDSLYTSQYYIGLLLKESFLNLGPTFVKVGQSLSTRPDIIGSEISKALSELHDKIPPFPRAVAVKIIEEELGCPVDSMFSYISDEPVAAASFGQVYRGCTLDGSIVAVKVQRPDLLHVIMRDIYILRLGLAFLRKVAKRQSDLSLYADELGKGLVGELDYTKEAANASEFLEAHSQYSFISVPKVLRKLTRKRVLTMEWMIGENPNNLLMLSRGSGQGGNHYSERIKLEAKTCILDLVNKGVEATLVQLFDTGLLHADPHPGNLRYTPEGCIGFLDFGLLCRMEKKHQLAMLAFIVHIVNGDWGALVYDLTEMDIVRPGTNLHRVKMDLEEALDEVVFNDGIPDIKFSRVLGKIWSIALKYQFRMPPYYTLILRSLASLEGLALAADQNFKTFQSAYPYVVQKLLYDNSASTRRILYSVVFNKRREFQWKFFLLFLRIGSMRNGTNVHNMLLTCKSSAYSQNVREGVFEVANLILQLLPSKDGIVLRRLLMTADATSLTGAMISKDATFIRQHLSWAIADIICHWMIKAVGWNEALGQHNHQVIVVKGQQERQMDLPPAPSTHVLQKVLSDRRMKVIFYKVLHDVRGDPILMLRLSWSSFTIFVTAAALALHRFLVYCLGALFTSVSFVPRHVAVM
ncbi:uncharacterized protein slr1919 isoform X1 [Phoenix dactylifera]|uniref:Uncharacterized protein slr1919 isoform X1 n=1 Tax=Phoenix dactylifera TaxID=42345 RepID=A0A8B7CVI1_PHODC|nr:uncharacterized protein slr1919 isoform X1 [Phoenix dactylifera]